MILSELTKLTLFYLSIFIILSCNSYNFNIITFEFFNYSHLQRLGCDNLVVAFIAIFISIKNCKKKKVHLSHLTSAYKTVCCIKIFLRRRIHTEIRDDRYEIRLIPAILNYLISQSLDIKAFLTAKSFLYFFKSGLVAQAATAPTNKTHEIDTKCGGREVKRKLFITHF